MARKVLSVRRSRQLSLRHFMALWVCLIVLAFAALGVGMFYEAVNLNSALQHIAADTQSSQTSRKLEVALLSASREDEAWHLRRDQRSLHKRNAYFAEADTLVADLSHQAYTVQETLLTKRIQVEYQQARAASDPPASAGKDMTMPFGVEDGLFQTIRQLRDITTWEMEDTLRSSNAREDLIHAGSLFVMTSAGIIVLVGGIALWSRIFRPVLELQRASHAFGQGDLNARARAVGSDEMAELHQTFNTMAEAIQDRERDRLDFVASVVHDLKNPLTAIKGAALTCQQHDLIPEIQEEMHTTIVDMTESMEEIIAELNDATLVQTGRLVLETKALDLAALVANTIQTHRTLFRSHVIHCDTPEVCPVMGDRKRLERVLVNLVSNAVKYSAPGSEVRLEVYAEGEKAVVRVQDAGVGIAPEDLDKLFSPFVRLERTKKMAKGTGLGLSSVHSILQAHGGDIQIRSELGKGTVVEVSLPLRSEADCETSTSSSDASA